MNRDFERLKQRKVDELIGICAGIAADGLINKEEVDFICSWLNKNREATTCFPGDILVSRLRDMLDDGVLDAEESEELLSLLRESSGQQFSSSIAASSANLPFDDPAPAVEFSGRIFVFSGIFAFGPRAACESAVRARGGEAHPKVTERANYLVVGSAANPEWKHASFGTKILRAIEIKKSGLPLALITEDHWAEAIVETPETDGLESAAEKTIDGKVEGKRFLFTGMLYGVSRDTAQRWVESLGGQVTSSLSTRLDYVVYGYDPGPKLERALSLGIPVLDRDAFLRMVGRSGANIQPARERKTEAVWPFDAVVRPKDGASPPPLHIKEIPGIAGKHFTFTGYLHGISPGEAEKRVRQAGGIVEHTVTKSRTDFIVSNRISRTELNRAAKWGKPIISGKELLEMLKGKS